MRLNEFQDRALTTRRPNAHRLEYAVMGLVGEAGEVANVVKKIMRGDRQLDYTTKRELALELGDVLWYLAAAAKDLGYDLQSVAELNHDKLAERRRTNQPVG